MPENSSIDSSYSSYNNSSPSDIGATSDSDRAQAQKRQQNEQNQTTGQNLAGSSTTADLLVTSLPNPFGPTTEDLLLDVNSALGKSPNPNALLDREQDCFVNDHVAPPPIPDYVGMIEPVHASLDVAGIVPIAGSVPDVINAGLYALEGDVTNAALSGAAAIPGPGDLVSLGSIGAKGVAALGVALAAKKVANNAEGATEVAKGIDKADDAAKTAKDITQDVVTDNGLVTRGGAHKNVKGIPGNESHHLIADSVSPIGSRNAPAISMEKSDHVDTASWGNFKEAEVFRGKQGDLANSGRLEEAMEMGIEDVKEQFGEKYDEAIKQAVEYSKTLDGFGAD